MQTLRTSLGSEWQFAERVPAGKDLTFLKGGEKTWLPAQVPGHVHLDLVRNGVIGDPFYRMQERGCAWVDEADWTYRTVFHVSAERLAARGEHGKHFLHFHGLDTICRVFLNGVKIGEAENFFIPHRFDVTDALREGENDLRVEFDSALRVGLERARTYLGDGTSTRGKMSYFNFGPRAFVRKPQYMFGWDWGPELVSCGIWQKVELETVPVAEIAGWTYDYQFIGANAIQTTITVEVERHDLEANIELDVALTHQFTRRVTSRNGSISLLSDADDKPRSISAISVPAIHGRIAVKADFLLENASAWQPTGENDKASGSHRISIRLRSGDSKLDLVTARVGFRRVELVRELDKDGKGEGMLFRVNGVDTFIKGANWIPDHSLPATITRDRIRQRLMQAKEAGFNMLRVWGGGLYESEDFYELCDHIGILVWQDFPFACSSYPDDLPEFREQVRQEAIVAIRRIRNHPCLALWCGGNENIELFQGRWDGATMATEFFGDRLIHDVLPEVLAAEDPNTPYLPNSPYGGDNVTSEDCGDSHYWNVWHAKTPDSTGDWTNYALSTTRFSSEFGFAAPAGLAAWDSCMAPEDRVVPSVLGRSTVVGGRWSVVGAEQATGSEKRTTSEPNSPPTTDHRPLTTGSPAEPKQATVFEWHDKTRKGTEKYLNYIRMHYPDPQTFEDLVYYGQCNQADALQFGVEHWRRLKGRCWGTLFWQLNDCWPTHSWAVVDSMGEPKAAYYAAKRFYAPLLLSLFREGDAVAAYLVNDGLEPVPGVLTLRLLTFDGEELARAESDAIAPANAASGPILTLNAATSRDAFVHATFRAADGTELAANFQLLAEPKDLRLSDPAFAFAVTQKEPGAAEIILSAARFARYVWLHFDDLATQPRLSDNFFHLAPGQTRKIAVGELPNNLSVAELRARLRLRWR